jgi:hypothetical protein
MGQLSLQANPGLETRLLESGRDGLSQSIQFGIGDVTLGRRYRRSIRVLPCLFAYDLVHGLEDRRPALA